MDEYTLTVHHRLSKVEKRSGSGLRPDIAADLGFSPGRGPRPICRSTKFPRKPESLPPKGHFVDYVAGLYFLRAVDSEVYQRSITQLTGEDLDAEQRQLDLRHPCLRLRSFGESNFNSSRIRFAASWAPAWLRDELSYDFQRVSTSPVAVPAISPNFTSSGSTGNYGYNRPRGAAIRHRQGHQYLRYVLPRLHRTLPYNVFFNMAASAALALKPETSNAYELGLKSRSLGGRLQVNVAAYLTDFGTITRRTSRTC